jgi:hypothetical protein
MPKMRVAAIVHGSDVVNSVVLPPGAAADAYLAAFDGVTVVADLSDEYGVEFVTLTGCLALEVTDLDPRPGIASGWTYVDGEWVAPPVVEELESEPVD